MITLNIECVLLRPTIGQQCADATSLLMRQSAGGGLPNRGMGMMSLRMGIENENGSEWNSAFAAHTHSLTPSGHQLTPSAINATSQSARLSVRFTVSTFTASFILYSCLSSQFYLLSIVTSVCAVLDQPPLLPLSHSHSF